MRQHPLSRLSGTVACAALLSLSALPVQAAGRVNANANDRAFAASARSVDRGGQLNVGSFLLDGDSGTSDLELTRFEVWRPNARVEIDGRRVPAPTTAYFKGRVVGEEGSIAFLSVREDGGVRGLVQKASRSWVVGKGRGQGALRSRRADDTELPPFECGVEGAGPSNDGAGLSSLFVQPQVESMTVLDQPYVANLAIDTDYEFYAKFGNSTDALDYIGDLVGYSDVTYSREIDTDMQIGFSRLFTGGPASDPWAATSGTSAALSEFRAYWNANMTNVDRTVAHLLSGKGLGGGIAYLSVLCENYSYEKGASEDYGVSASLGGSFSWDGDQSHDPASVVWDIVVFQHEIGHNFSSPHTHDYCGIGGSNQPIDQCWDGCLGDTVNVVPSCSAPTPHYTSGGGAGTIMSYCHQRSGGYGNIAMTFGEGHTCGVLPDREAAQMTSHVVSRANLYPACFGPQTCGNGQLDPGEECDGGLLGGATCSSEGFFGGTLTCSSSCTFDTSQCTNCGNGVIDSGEICDGGDLGGATCSDFSCSGGVLSCNASCSGFDKSLCDNCPQCNENFVCDAGEDCNGCPSDCAGGTTSGAICGNGVCEAGNGEDCLSCPSDCAGKQSGKPSGRFCCGDGGGAGPVGCSDARCTTGGYSCTEIPVSPGSFCCGDDTCDAGESCSVCALDCAGGAEICGNGIDDDCNGDADCADLACLGDSSCSCGQSNSFCTSNGDCCSGNCRTKGKKANTCA